MPFERFFVSLRHTCRNSNFLEFQIFISNDNDSLNNLVANFNLDTEERFNQGGIGQQILLYLFLYHIICQLQKAVF